ncbi:MAG: DUF58 domain-containing protein [Rhodobacteraceae bacterium]|nr:MAG: DUF58 domain-containing protein [Paracoccaceae bacterium]
MTQVLQGVGVALQADALIALRRVALAAKADPVLAALPGGISTRRKGHGLEVADKREYVAGDDLRHLDRGATARTGRLHIRQFQEERDRVTLLIADFRPAMFWGISRAFRSVVAAEALAMIGWNVVEAGGRVGLLAVTPGDPVIVPARARVRGMLDVIGGMVQAHCTGLDMLMAGQGDSNLRLDQSLARVERIAPAGAELVLASGFDAPGDGLPDRLDALAQRRDPQLVLITDAQATRLPRGRYPIRLPDGGRTKVYLRGPTSAPREILAQIAGRQALVLDGADKVEDMARHIAASFAGARAT